MADKLTPKQDAFVRAYLKTGSPSEAYRLAYDAKAMNDKAVSVEGARLLKNPSVALDIERLQLKATDKAVLSKAWVIERLMRNVQIAMGEETIKQKIAKKNKETGEVLVIEIDVTDRDTAGANRGLELLGKELGMFVDRSEIGKPGDFDHMSDDELREFVARRAADLGEGGKGARTPRGNGKAGKQLN